MRRKSLLTKMVLLGCLLSILPVVFIGDFSYQQSSKQAQQQAREAEMQYIRQVNSNMEQIFVTVNHTLTNLADSTVMEKALRRQMTEYDFQLYNELRNEISHLQSFDTMVGDVVILNRNKDWLIKNSGLYRLSKHADGRVYEAYFGLPGSIAWGLTDNSRLSDAASAPCRYSVSVVRKLPVKELKAYGLAIANIPSCELAGMIDYDQGAKEVMVVDEEGRIVIDRNRSMVGKPLAETPYFRESQRFDQPSGQYRVRSGGGAYLVTYYKSGLNRWTYLSVVSIDRLTRDSKKIGWITLGICLGIIALSVGLVWLGSRKIYRPVQKLTQWIEQSFPDAQAKSQTDLQLIEAHIRSLFSSNTELMREVQNHAKEVRSLFMRQLYGGTLRQAEIREKLAYFGLSPIVANWRQMSVLAIAVDTLEHSKYHRNDMELLLFAAANIAEETVPDGNRLPPVWIDQTVAVLVGCDGADAPKFDDLLYEWTELLQSRVQRYLGLSVSIGVSSPFGDFKAASRAYREGLEALMHRLKLGKGAIVRYGSLDAASPSIGRPYPLRTEMELTDAIKLADREAALERLREWMDKAFSRAEAPQDYHVSMMRLLNALLIVQQEAGIRFDQTGGSATELYEELLALHIQSEIEEWFARRMVLPMIGVFEDRRESQYRDLSERIIDLIQQHYDTDLTLEACANRLHYNANYLSGVFRKETGTTFSEYLANYRLQMARKWLLETDMTVKEISDRLRYTNPQNFIRSFRKQEGLTPGQYRLLKG